MNVNMKDWNYIVKEGKLLEYVEDMQIAYLQRQFGDNYLEVLETERTFLSSEAFKNKMDHNIEKIINHSEKVSNDLKELIEKGKIEAHFNGRDDVDEADEMEHQKKIINKLINTRNPHESQSYSKYEDPGTMVIIDRIRLIATETFKRFFEKYDDKEKIRNIIKNCYIGSVYTLDYNAFATKPNSNEEFAIFFNVGLPLFLARISRITATLDMMTPIDKYESLDFSSDSWRDGYAKLITDLLDKHENSYLIENFLAAITEYFRIDLPYNYDHSKFHSLARIIAEIHATAAEVFVIMHEFAHIFNGDTHKSENETEISEEKNNIKEIRADSLGLILFYNSAEHAYFPGIKKNHFLAQFDLGPQLFFQCAILIEEYAKFLGLAGNLNKDTKSTHPSPTHRLIDSYKFYEKIDANYVYIAEKLNIEIKLLSQYALQKLNYYLKKI